MNHHTLTKYQYNLNRLLNARDPEQMFGELLSSGFKYITEDFLKVVDDQLRHENNHKIRLERAKLSSTPPMTDSQVGLIGVKKRIEKTNIIRDLIENGQKVKEFKKDFKSAAKKEKLTLRQLALKCYYEERQVRRSNADDIAKEQGHSSGERLFQLYTYYCSLTNRRGRTSPFTEVKMKNKVDLFEKVLEILPDDKNKQAKEDLNHLKQLQNELY